MGTANLRDAITRQNRFLALAEKEGFEAAQRELQGEENQGSELERLETLYNKFCEVGQNPVSDDTRKNYISALRRVAKWCGAKKIRDLDDTKARIGWRKENPNGSEASLRGLLKSAASVFKVSALAFYKKQGFTVENPLTGMDLKTDGIQPYRPFKAGLRQKIEAECEEELEPAQALVVLLALKIGLRSGEIAAARLEWLREVAPGKWLFRVQEEESFKPKGREIRDFPIAEKLAAQLLELRGEADSEFLVPNALTGKQRLKGHIQTVAIWLRLKGVTGRKPVHTLRKECGSVLATTFNMLVASRVLGHKSITTTEKYYASLTSIPTIGEDSPLAIIASQYGVDLAELEKVVKQLPKVA